MQAHYQSPQVVLNAIVEEIKQALYYSIIVGGTPDVSHTEQIAFILRYVNLNEKVWEICERFLKMENCDKKRKGYAESSKNMILNSKTVEVKGMLEFTMELKQLFWRKIPRRCFLHAAHIVLIFVRYMQQSRQLFLKASLETFGDYTFCSALVLVVGRFCKRLLVYPYINYLRLAGERE